ncbi:hypothetical protein Ahy_B09g095213 [Arachis hypogaea]|uniref:DUF4283 domain-containing protein n=1 Tax=Arachis hypogaea TaxID=3818 RepID=A0A444XD68_ARAHY|nr:hypothetical protein Ahy_B09g095213 [Arachis hypogaea]
MEIVPVEENPIPGVKSSYKDTLLTGPGLESDQEEPLNMDDHEPNPEDKWYQDDQNGEDVEEPFNPCPTIPVSKEEFEEWCKPWKNALMVKVLGKRVTFTFMEQRLCRDWESKGKIHVIDMNRDYFLVHFSDEEDYTHALMEGPWMIAGHYLIVQRWRPFFLADSTEEGNQNGKSESPQNQTNHINGQSSANFGPWMLVKRYARKAQSHPKKSQTNLMPIPSYIAKKDGSPTGKDSAQGSRFDILNEENLGNAQVSMEGSDKVQEETEQIGPQQPKDQEVFVRTHSLKRVPKAGAGKNPQIKKKLVSTSRALLEQGDKPNQNRNTTKNSENALANPNGVESPTRAMKGKEKDPELEGMELVVKDYMRRMEKEKWEAFNSAKDGRMNLDQHAVRDNMLFRSDKNSKPLGTRLGTPDPKGNLRLQAESSMVEAGDRGRKGVSLARDQVATEGTGNKAFPSTIRDLRQEYGANLVFLLETHISGTRGKQIRDKIGFDKAFIVEADGRAGGIWCLWDSSVWTVDILEHDKQYIHLRVSGAGNFSSPWIITAVYGSPQRTTKKILWSSIKTFASNVNLPWCLLGDFNALLHNHEKRICSTWKNVNQSSIWRIGDGSQIRFWDHCWIPGVGRLSESTSQVSRFANNSDLVTDFLNVSGQWDVGKLQGMLPQSIINKIVAISPPSPWKEADEESTSHVLRDCYYARSIWHNFDPPNGSNSFFSTDLNEWLFQNLTSNNSWACLFGVTVASLWYFRNKLVFDGESVTTNNALHQIRARAEEFLKGAIKDLNPRSSQAASACLVRWSPPNGDEVKLNVDGSWFSDRSNAACGGVFRDSMGRFLKRLLL